MLREKFLTNEGHCGTIHSEIGEIYDDLCIVQENQKTIIIK